MNKLKFLENQRRRKPGRANSKPKTDIFSMFNAFHAFLKLEMFRRGLSGWFIGWFIERSIVCTSWAVWNPMGLWGSVGVHLGFLIQRDSSS